ncbi:MAG TPA: response regulator transcription factor [Anaerolineales bacterium]|nr:response regulator transcription factor [Anaerolineales bacterium]
MRILLVEDNQRLSDSLKRSLVNNGGYVVDTAYDGAEGEELAMVTEYDLIILDVMLPIKDGFEVCRSLRENNINIPILMLTARDALSDRVTGLDSGADDYLVKPFEIEELHARLRALLRRESPDKNTVLKIADLTLDPATHVVERAGQAVELTAREYALLEYLMRNSNRLVTRRMIENSLWSYESTVASNVVDVYIRRLRRKVDDPFEVKLIETIRGSGYRINRSKP